jgi:hypothetical protein
MQLKAQSSQDVLHPMVGRPRRTGRSAHHDEVVGEIEGGVNPNALSRARWAIAALQSTECGDYIDKKLNKAAIWRKSNGHKTLRRAISQPAGVPVHPLVRSEQGQGAI